MYDDMIAALMQDMGADTASARARALRDQPPPKPPPPMPLQQPMPQQQAPSPGVDLTGTWGQQMAQPGGMPPQPMPQQQAQPARQGPALPRTMAQVQPPPQNAPGPVPAAPDAPDPLMGEYDRLMKQREALLQEQAGAYQPQDRAASEAAYQQRANEGPKMLLHALAAQRAGKGFEGFQQHYMRQASEAGAPMKMAGGMMTPQGFIEDPGYQQELAIKRADLKLQQLQTALNSNLTAQERRRLEKERERAADERQRAELGMRQTVAGITASGKADAAAGRKEGQDIRNETTLSKQFDAQTKDYATELDSTRKLNTIAPGRRPNAIEQQSMIVLLNKFLDPTSVVREGEFNRVAEAQGLIQRAQNWINRVGSGEPMSDALINDIRAMGQLYEQAAGGKIKEYGDLYSDKARRYGLNPENVVVSPYYRHAKADATPEGTVAVNPATKERLVFKGGQWVKP